MVTFWKLLWKERKAFKANVVAMFQTEEARSFQGVSEIYSSTLNFGTTHSCFFNGMISLEVLWLVGWFFLHVIVELPPDTVILRFYSFGNSSETHIIIIENNKP